MSNHYAPPRSEVADVGAAGGAITGEMIDAMRGTKPWVMLIGVLMLIGAGFTVLAGLGMMFGGSMMSRGPAGAPPTALLMGMGAAYLLFSLIYVFLGVYLVKYSSAIGRLLSSGQSADMEGALEQQRKFWRLAGVLSLVGLVLAVLGIIAAIAIPSYMAMTHGIPPR